MSSLIYFNYYYLMFDILSKNKIWSNFDKFVLFSFSLPVYLAACGETLNIVFSLPFTDFVPTTCNTRFSLRVRTSCKCENLSWEKNSLFHFQFIELFLKQPRGKWFQFACVKHLIIDCFNLYIHVCTKMKIFLKNTNMHMLHTCINRHI